MLYVAKYVHLTSKDCCIQFAATSLAFTCLTVPQRVCAQTGSPANPPSSLRALWIDDVPSVALGAGTSTALMRGDVTLFPGRWLTVLGDIPPGRDLRFRLGGDGKIFGTMGDLTDWLASPPALITDMPYLYAVSWRPQVASNSARPSSLRQVLALGAGDHGWTVLAGINEADCACGAMATSAPSSNGAESVQWHQYRATAWAGVGSSSPVLSVLGPQPSFANALGEGAYPLVCGLIADSCLLGTYSVPKAAIAVTNPSGMVPLVSIVAPECADGLIDHSAVEAVQPSCQAGGASKAIGWSLCSPCTVNLSAFCLIHTEADASTVTIWDVSGHRSRTYVGNLSGADAAPFARMISASKFASAGSIVSRYLVSNSTFPCETEHAAVFRSAEFGFIDLHTVLPGGSRYGSDANNAEEQTDPLDGVLRRNSRVAAIIETSQPCSAGDATQWLAVGARFGSSFDPTDVSTGGPVGVIWRSRQNLRTGALDWCGSRLLDLVGNAPAPEIVMPDGKSFRVKFQITTLHDVRPSGAAVGLATLEIVDLETGQPAPYDVVVPGWGQRGAKLVLFTRPADFDLDTNVGGSDLGLLLGSWGAADATALRCDLNSDGLVNGADLGILLGQWTPVVGDVAVGLQIGNCGHPVTLPAVVEAVQFLGFGDLEAFGTAGVMIGTDGFVPFAGIVAELAQEIAAAQENEP